MIIKFQYTTNQGGIWRDEYTDLGHETRMLNFLTSLSTPLPTQMTVITHTMAGLPEAIVVHSFRTHDGVEWDAINGLREKVGRSSPDSAYDEVWKEDNNGS